MRAQTRSEGVAYLGRPQAVGTQLSIEELNAVLGHLLSLEEGC